MDATPETDWMTGIHVQTEPVRGELGATILGPRNVAVEAENPSSMAAPLTDAGTVPNLKYPYAQAHNRVLTGGWAREITTRELADQKLITKVYPVRDLVLHVPDFTEPPELNLNTANSGGRGGGGGQSILSGSGGRETKASIERERGEQLVATIMQTVQPDAWRENGGTSSIRFFDGHLVVTAPRSVHEALGGSFQQ